jgi:hypothetical protein
MRRLSLSDREALYILWALEEALLLSEPEEEETLSSLLSKFSGSAAPFSSASLARSRSLALSNHA